MKKLIYTFGLFLVASLTANAQEKAVNYQELAKQSLNTISAAIPVSETQSTQLLQLFENKFYHSSSQLSAERKKALKSYYTASINKILNPSQIKTLQDNNSLLLEKLTE